MTRQIDPQKALERIAQMAPLFAQAKANRIYMDEYRKTIKARLMQECGLDSIGAQEREAYAHPEYAQHLHALKEAVEEEEKLRWLLVAAEAAVEVWRSQESSARLMDRAAR